MKRLQVLVAPLASASDMITVVLATLSVMSWTVRTVPLSTTAAVKGEPYELFDYGTGSPVAWDCSQPIHVSMNASALPDDLRREVMTELTAVLGTISARSPFRLSLVSATERVPTTQWGRQWFASQSEPPVIFFVGDPSRSDLWLPGKAAVGGLFPMQVDDRGTRAAAGFVIIDIDQLDDYYPGHGYRSRGALFTHELLHVLGLDHTDHPSSMMTPRVSDSSGELGEGDLAALRHLAAVGCGY
jgi:hypothetical protein